MRKIEYYLMRHASYYGSNNQFVTYGGMLYLKNFMDSLKVELDEKFPKRKLHIIHSTLPRAVHTALLMRDMLSGGIEVSLEGDRNLDCDNLQITEEYVKRVVPTCDDKNKVCLILSHQPDINYFCKKELDPSEYLCKSIYLAEKPTATNDTADDLPF